jgi:hypothetical protein
MPMISAKTCVSAGTLANGGGGIPSHDWQYHSDDPVNSVVANTKIIATLLERKRSMFGGDGRAVVKDGFEEGWGFEWCSV